MRVSHSQTNLLILLNWQQMTFNSLIIFDYLRLVYLLVTVGYSKKILRQIHSLFEGNQNCPGSMKSEVCSGSFSLIVRVLW